MSQCCPQNIKHLSAPEEFNRCQTENPAFLTGSKPRVRVLAVPHIGRAPEHPTETKLLPLLRRGCSVAFSLSKTLRSPGSPTTLQQSQMITARGRERRSSRRCVPSRVTTCCLETLTGEILGNGQVYNLSSLGMGLLCPQPLDEGVCVRVTVTNSQCTYFLNLEFLVVRCMPIPGVKDFFVGGQFERRLACEELQPFII